MTVFTHTLYIYKLELSSKVPSFRLLITGFKRRKKNNCFDNVKAIFQFLQRRKWNIPNTWRVTKSCDFVKRTKNSIQFLENEWMRRHFIFPNSLVSESLTQCAWKQKADYEGGKWSYLFLRFPRMPHPCSLRLPAHLGTMCGRPC